MRCKNAVGSVVLALGTVAGEQARPRIARLGYDDAPDPGVEMSFVVKVGPVRNGDRESRLNGLERRFAVADDCGGNSAEPGGAPALDGFDLLEIGSLGVFPAETLPNATAHT